MTNDIQQQSTSTLIKIRNELRVDAQALIFINPQEAGKLADLAIKIGHELRHRRVIQ